MQLAFLSVHTAVFVATMTSVAPHAARRENRRRRDHDCARPIQPLRPHAPPRDKRRRPRSPARHQHDRRQPVIPLKNCHVARRREDRQMVPGDQAVGDARTTESQLRDLRAESGSEWPGNRLYGVSEKCIRHKPRERGENSTPRMANAYVISNT